MKSTETGVLKKSEIYFSSPSQTAKRLYYYPISAGHFFCVDGYHLVRENYSSILIKHIIDGSFTFIKDTVPVTAVGGDTVILNCYEPHEYYTDSGFESIWVHIAGANSLELFKEIEQTQGSIVKCRDIHRIKKLLFRIYNGISGTNPPSELNMSLDIYKLFTELLTPQSIKSKGDGDHEDCIEEVKEFILDHLGESLTVSRLAGCVHMSVSHFSRVFKQQTGFSPYDYVLTSRLNRAKDLLQKTDMPISAVAYETGFNSESNFICFFSENEGVSPGRFRKLEF